MKTARDLGPPGPDDQFGAGEADAFAAVSAVPASSMPVAAVSERPGTPEMSQAPKDQSKDQSKAEPETRGLPMATMAAEKPAERESRPDVGESKP
jgi:hypothetical protein